MSTYKWNSKNWNWLTGLCSKHMWSGGLPCKPCIANKDQDLTYDGPTWPATQTTTAPGKLVGVKPEYEHEADAWL
jgi:hypothetical protein